MKKEELLAEFEEFYRQLHGLPDDALLAGGKLMKDFVFKAFDAGVEAAQKEICICAAVKTADGQTIVRGNRHHNCLEDIHQRKLQPGEQGFITSTGRFVSRLEGRRLQDAAGVQSVSPDGYQNGTLYSEDLY